jgi:1,4-dihydroxy-2-naphthoate octaprenyltransferase
VTSAKHWIEGARPRTLPAAVAPVLVGTAAAAWFDGFLWWKALLALGVSLALQIGVNYANDYSDGIKGTDDVRVGPIRLVGQGLAPAAQVKAAALGFLALGGALGFVLAATSSWWLLLVGAAALAAAWTYTGGPNPYGYRALGELSVFVFFGLVAVLGTQYVQLGRIEAIGVRGAFGIGALACAILVVNNLRDIPTDREVGKRTLAVILGDAWSRRLFVILHAAAFILPAWIALTVTPYAWLYLLAAVPSFKAARTVARGATGPALIPALRDTGMAELVYAIGLSAGLVIGTFAG